MNLRHLLALCSGAIVLAGCESGDIVLSPTNVDNSTSTGGGGSGTANPCAAYERNGQTVQGTFDGEHCTYGSSFVSYDNPLVEDLELPLIDGVHVFTDVLAVGVDVNTGTAPAGGTGPSLTVPAGSVLAFNDENDYILINRGSQLIADGTADAPITFTSVTDAVLGTVGPEDVQQWGGIVINGNGITNNCTDAQRASNDCHVESEGRPSFYGGNDNAESSGILRYVVTKHTGSEAVPDNELNGITFNAVGSGTEISHLQVYSTYDDGIEFFGGAVNVDHFVAMYVRDDSIDFSDGYVGTIDTALIIQAQFDGNRCIEGDNIGEGRAGQGAPLDTLPITEATILNMTCIVSVQDVGTHSDVSEGPTLRRGPKMHLADSIVFGAYAVDTGANNECFEIAEDGITDQWALTGETTVNHTLIACSLATNLSLPNGDSSENWLLNASTVGANYDFNVGNVVLEAPDLYGNHNLAVLDSFYTLPLTDLVDHLANPIAMTPQSGQLGAVTRTNDWTAGWTYGLHADNQGQELWFGNP